MTARSFAVTFDYRCPFARNACELVMAGLLSGAPWKVDFIPFSLGQVKAASEGGSVWDDPDAESGLLALQAGVAVRDDQPERFLEAHRALFGLRHDRDGDLRDEAGVLEALEPAGVDTAAVREALADGGALKTVRAEHEQAVADHGVWGVPTFVVDGQAAFIRLMERHDGDDHRAVATVERVLDLAGGWPTLNELKHTTIPR